MPSGVIPTPTRLSGAAASAAATPSATLGSAPYSSKFCRANSQLYVIGLQQHVSKSCRASAIQLACSIRYATIPCGSTQKNKAAARHVAAGPTIVLLTPPKLWSMHQMKGCPYMLTVRDHTGCSSANRSSSSMRPRGTPARRACRQTAHKTHPNRSASLRTGCRNSSGCQQSVHTVCRRQLHTTTGTSEASADAASTACPPVSAGAARSVSH